MKGSVEKIRQAVCEEAGVNPPDEVRTARDLVEETLEVFERVLQWAEAELSGPKCAEEVLSSLDRIDNLVFELRHEMEDANV